LFVCFQIYSYKLVGIPLFSEGSRLGLYGGGSGIVKRILDVTQPVLIYFLIDRFFRLKKNVLIRIYDIFILIFLIMSLFLSGSKSNFLNIVFIMFFYKFYNYKIYNNKKISKKINKYMLVIFSAAFISALIIIILTYNVDSIFFAFRSLLIRIVKYGDVFIFTYPVDVLESLDFGNWFLKIFKDFLGMFRLIPWDELPASIGLKIYQYIYNTNVIRGPNARHNIFGLVYFGFFGSVIYSFVIGYIISFVRNKIYFILKKNQISGIIYMLLVQIVIGFNTDISLQLSQLNSILIVFIPVILVSYFIVVVGYKLNLEKE
jgi:oligosaccharide repeat unit polymerase